MRFGQVLLLLTWSQRLLEISHSHILTPLEHPKPWEISGEHKNVSRENVRFGKAWMLLTWSQRGLGMSHSHILCKSNIRFLDVLQQLEQLKHLRLRVFDCTIFYYVFLL